MFMIYFGVIVDIFGEKMSITLLSDFFSTIFSENLIKIHHIFIIVQITITKKQLFLKFQLLKAPCTFIISLFYFFK